MNFYTGRACTLSEALGRAERLRLIRAPLPSFRDSDDERRRGSGEEQNCQRAASPSSQMRYPPSLQNSESRKISAQYPHSGVPQTRCQNQEYSLLTLLYRYTSSRGIIPQGYIPIGKLGLHSTPSENNDNPIP